MAILPSGFFTDVTRTEPCERGGNLTTDESVRPLGCFAVAQNVMVPSGVVWSVVMLVSLGRFFLRQRHSVEKGGEDVPLFELDRDDVGHRSIDPLWKQKANAATRIMSICRAEQRREIAVWVHGNGNLKPRRVDHD